MKKFSFLFFILTSLLVFLLPIVNVFAGTVLKYDGKTVPYNASPIVLKINNKTIDQSTLPMQPIIIDGTTLVPVREVFEALGAKVDYKDTSQEVFISYNKTLINMKINDLKYTVNGQSKSFSVPPKIINGKTMIPLRSVSEGMGLEVNWDGITRTININDSSNTITETPIVLAVDKSPVSFSEASNPTAKVSSIIADTSSVTINFSSPITNVSKFLLNDNRLIFDLINTTNGLNPTINVPTNTYYTQIRTSQFATAPTAISRVVLQVNNGIYYSTLLSTDRTQLKIYFGNASTSFPTTLDSGNKVTTPVVTTPPVTVPVISTPNVTSPFTVSYDKSSHSILIPKTTGITKNSVSINDYDAFRKNIIVDFNSNYTDLFGNSAVAIGDTYLNSYTPSLTNGNSRLNVTLNSWGTLNVTENDAYVIISFIDPHKLYSKIVIIDAGHGGTDVGTTGNNMFEKTLNFSVAQQFGSFINSETNIKVYYTRIDDTLLGLKEIGQFASAMGDLLFSVHTNGYSNALPTGVETLYLEHSNDATIGISSKACAEIVQKHLVADTGLYNRGAKSSKLIIFKNSTIPSVLGEMGFISNPFDAQRLADPTYLTLVARSYANSTIEIFSQYTPKR